MRGPALDELNLYLNLPPINHLNTRKSSCQQPTMWMTWQQLQGVATTNSGGGGRGVCQWETLHNSQRVDGDPTTSREPWGDGSMEAALTTGDGAWAPESWPLLCAQVTFLVTEDPSRGQRRVRREVLSPLRFEPYEVVALASGGEVIFTQDQHIRDVAAVVGDSTADLVSGRTEGQGFQLGAGG